MVYIEGKQVFGTNGTSVAVSVIGHLLDAVANGATTCLLTRNSNWKITCYTPLTTESEYFRVLECFCVLIYNKTSDLDSVNNARRELFYQKNWMMETIPPTQDALLQHSRRAAYQAGIYWSLSDETQYDIPIVPSPEGYGWTMTSEGKSCMGFGVA